MKHVDAIRQIIINAAVEHVSAYVANTGNAPQWYIFMKNNFAFLS